MALNQPLVLPNDVIVIPVADLSSDVRSKIECSDDDVAVTRPGLRTPSRIMDPDGARLLEEFRRPSRIVDAVLRFSQASGRDPEETLEEAFQMLAAMVKSKILVSADAEDAEKIRASLQPGDSLAGWRIEQVVQVLEDTEVYQARGADETQVAVKTSRRGTDSGIELLLKREAEILKLLDGRHTPRLLDQGQDDDRRYLILSWCPGRSLTGLASQLRWGAGYEWRQHLHSLCRQVLEAYRHLHQQGILHVDVQPNNLLVDDEQHVWIIDFGFAHVMDPSSPFHESYQAGVPAFYDPELARGFSDSSPAPPVSAQSEQYRLGALIYKLITGADYLNFSADKDAFCRQICEDAVLPFVKRSFEPWPEVERVLRRALSKNPADRYSSLEEFCQAFQQAQVPESPAASKGTWEEADALVERMLAELLPGGNIYEHGLASGPRCTVNLGSGGLAYFLYRLSQVRDDPELLAAADAWANRTIAAMSSPQAFYDEELEMTEDVVGTVSLHHTASGTYCVQALIGHAMGDPYIHLDNINHFITNSRGDCENLDLTLGRSSTLIGCSLLTDTLLGESGLEGAPVVEFGHQIEEQVWQRLDAFPPIRECRDFPNLGIAHGWAGGLYGIMRLCRSSGRPLPDGLQGRLQELAEFAERYGRGYTWRGSVPLPDLDSRVLEYAPGWCSGSAGHVHLWTLAHEIFKDHRYLDLAEGSAWFALEHPEGHADLCCGLAGRAYALLHFYQYTGERQWLTGARELAHRASLTEVDSMLHPTSLYRGGFGLALLMEDLKRPESAAMPFFGSEI